jgi:hypothetical protein
MSEISRGEINDIIAGFATRSPEYKKALLANPKKVLGKQMNQELPGFLKVKVVQDTADTVHLVLPHVPQEGELSDADLESVAGGKLDTNSETGNTYTCNDTVGGIATRTEVNIGG